MTIAICGRFFIFENKWTLQAYSLSSQWLLEQQASVNCVRQVQVGQCAEPIINQFDRSSFVIYYELMACHDLSKIAFFCTTTHTQLFIPRKSDNFQVVVFLKNDFLENRHFRPHFFLIGPIFSKNFLLFCYKSLQSLSKNL